MTLTEALEWLRARQRGAKRVEVGSFPALVGHRRRRGLVLVSAPTGVAARLGLRRQNGLPWVGDPVFDQSFVPEGPDPRSVRALLTAPLREATLALVRAGARGFRWGPRTVAIDVEVAALRAGAMARALETLVAELPREDFDEEARLLEVALRDPEVRVRSGAGEALLAGEVSPRAARALAESPSVRSWLRVDALWVLERWPEVVDVWCSLVRDPSTEVARHALERLGELRIVEARDVIAAALGDPREGVAAAAIQALGALRTDEEGLRKGLSDPRVDVRAAAVSAAALHAASSATARCLVGMAKTEASRELRRAAGRAVERIQGRLAPSGALGLVEAGAGTGTLSLTTDVPSVRSEGPKEDLGTGRKDVDGP